MWETWVGKIPWKRERLPTLVFWPGEFHELYSPWGYKKSDRTEWLSLSRYHSTHQQIRCLTTRRAREDMYLDIAYILLKVYVGATVLCKAWHYCSLACAITYLPLDSGLWVCGRNKGTGTGTRENVVVRVHQSGWLWWWKAAFHCRRYLNHKRVEHELVIKWYSTDL